MRRGEALLSCPWLLAILLLPFFEPSFIESQMPVLDGIIFVWRLAALVIAFPLSLECYNISNLVWSALAFHVYLLATTAVNCGAVASVISVLVKVVSICAIVEMALRNNARGTLIVLKLIFGVFLVVSLITTIAYPEGLFWSAEGVYEMHGSDVNAKRYFWGHKNMILIFFLPGIIAFSVDMLWRRSKETISAAFCFLAGVALNAWLVDSVTSMVVACMTLIALVLTRLKVVQNRGPFLWLGIVIGADVGITVLRIQEGLAGIVGVLGRSMTFSGRVGIWDRALYWIGQRPLLGYGVEPVGIAATRFGNEIITTAHNVYFTNLYYGGLIGLAFFASSFLLVAVKLYKARGSVAVFFKIFIPLLLVVGIFETMGMGLTNFIVPLAFAFNVDVFEESNSHSERNRWWPF